MPNPSINFDFFLDYIIDEDAFDRLNDYCNFCEEENENCFCDMTYHDFRRWNVKCFNDLSNDEKFLIKKLYDFKTQGKVCIMDQETCVVFSNREIFFNKQQKLVITCPR